LALDATRLFGKKRANRVGLASILELENYPEVQHAMVIHSWETKLDDNTSFTLKGTVLAKNGLGSGGIALQGRRIIDSSLWSEASVSIGDNPNASIKFVKNFSADQYATVSVAGQSLSSPPTIAMLFGRRITTNSTGYMQYTPDIASLFGFSGNDTSCSIGLNHFADDTQSTLDLYGMPV
jgi:hypothetical protein